MPPSSPSATEMSPLPRVVYPMPGDRVVLASAPHLAGTVVECLPFPDGPADLIVDMDAPWRDGCRRGRASITSFREAPRTPESQP